MPWEGGMPAYYQIRQFFLVGDIFHSSLGGMVHLEDLMVASRGGTTHSEGDIKTGGRQHGRRHRGDGVRVPPV